MLDYLLVKRWVVAVTELVVSKAQHTETIISSRANWVRGNTLIYLCTTQLLVSLRQQEHQVHCLPR